MAPPQRVSGLPTATRNPRVRQPTTRRIRSTASERPESSSSARSTANATRPPKSPVERDLQTEDTSIHVVVRCRGRSELEVNENSGVAVMTEGVKGRSVELSMGPNSVSNKAYTFDRVFSAAADQFLIFEDVVVPLVNEVITFCPVAYLC